MTQRHGTPDFTATYAVLAHYFKMRSPNEHLTGRTSAYTIPDMIDRGLNNIECATDIQEVERQADAEDLEVELF